MQRIQLPERTYEDFGDSIVQLHKVATLAGLSPGGFSIDMAGSKHLSPVLLCGVAALLRRHQESGIPSVVGNQCRDEHLTQYLDLIRFPCGLRGDLQSAECRRALNDTASKSFVPMVSFPADRMPNMEREELLQGIENDLARKSRMDGAAVQAMKYILSEITGNINYHAGHGTGFMVAQHSVNNHYLDIAIADTGHGLRGAYLASGKHNPATDLEALELALDGRSSKAESHRGFGIRTSRRMTVNGLGGWFLIWSGSAMLIDNASGARLVELVDGSPHCA